jgi:hypothetical protein
MKLSWQFAGFEVFTGLITILDIRILLVSQIHTYISKNELPPVPVNTTFGGSIFLRKRDTVHRQER